jgi:two-component system, sensor histidine kinase YesM
MKFLVRKIKNLSMVWKFTGIFFFLIMIPTLTFLFSYNIWTNKSMKQQSDTVSMITISQFENKIKSAITNTENIAKEIVFSGEVQAFLNNDFDFSEKELNYFTYNIQNKIINIKHLYPNRYYKIRIYANNNLINEEYDLLYSINRVKDKEYFSQINELNNNVLWGSLKEVEEYPDLSQSIFSQYNKNKVIPLYVPIRSLTSNKLVGILEIDILVEKMFGERWELSVGKNGSLAVYDKKGNIISANAGDKIFEEIKFNNLNEDSGKFTLDSNGNKYMVVYDTVKETEYKIVTVTSYESMNRNSIYFFMIIGSIFIFLITFFTIRFLFARLKLLTKLMRRVEDGEFDVRIEEKSMDEVGELARSFNKMAEKLKSTIVTLIEKETLSRDAEIRALQSQINPHFLYNTLESIKMECEIRDEVDIADTISSLGKLLRYNIKWNGGMTTLQKEIEHVNNFITIMQLRFKDKISYRVDVPCELLQCSVIKMILQPLVENSFSHGFSNKSDKWEILIKGYVRDGALSIEIHDNGLGIEETKLIQINEALEKNKTIQISSTSGSLIGLNNVNKRLKMQFGNEYGINIESTYMAGTKINIKLPEEYI